LAVRDDGRIFVADTSQVLVFRPDGVLAETIGKSGERPGQFNVVCDIALGNGELFVCDHWRVQVFGPRGQFLRMWELRAGPTAVAHRREEVFVGTRDDLQVFTTKGELVRRLPQRFYTAFALLDDMIVFGFWDGLLQECSLDGQVLHSQDLCGSPLYRNVYDLTITEMAHSSEGLHVVVSKRDGDCTLVTLAPDLTERKSTRLFAGSRICSRGMLYAGSGKTRFQSFP
jgi:hypothetical protein